ncbi:MAG: SMC-Scp complex subunit ScpB [Candidatus Bathyarchaeota archaeon]|nr:MAG: SMC-Scp complex subunit ScpB [Candidatus Bathyarchaeota archaeon]
MEKIELESSELLSKEKLKRNLALVEAALYVAGRPLDSKTLGSIIKTRSKSKVQKLVRVLMEKYESCESALEILELEDERFVLQLKTEFSPQVQRLAIRPLLSKGPLKTLSYTAFRQPVLQSQVVDVRGHHAYGHLRQLEDMGLISRERVGRSRLLRTTGFFADFFGLSHDLRTMKRQLKRVFEDFEKAERETE